MSALSRFFKHSGVYAVGNALNRLGAFILLPLYTRYLAPSEYGTLELFYLISSVVSGILAVGLSHATLRFYFEHDSQEDRNALVSTSLIASLLISGTGALLVFAAGDPLVAWVVGDVNLPWALPLVLTSMVLDLSSQVCLSYFRAREMSIHFVGVVLGKLVVQCAANTWFVAVHGAGIEGVLAGNALSVALGWVVMAAWVLRDCGLHFHLDKLRPVLRYSLPFLYTTVVAVLASNFDRFWVNRILSLEALGLYALATKFSRLISDLIGEPFSRAYGAFRYTIMKDPEAADIQARIVKALCVLLALVGLCVTLFTADVLRWMSSPAFGPAAQLLPLLVLAACAQVLIHPLQSGVLFRKESGELFKVFVKQSVVGVGASLLLLPLMGLQGACLAALLQSVAGVWLTHRASQRHFPVQYPAGPLWRLTGLTVLAWALSLPLAGLSPVPALAGKVLIVVAFVAVLAWPGSGVICAAEREAWRHWRARRAGTA